MSEQKEALKEDIQDMGELLVEITELRDKCTELYEILADMEGNLEPEEDMPLEKMLARITEQKGRLAAMINALGDLSNGL